MAMLLLQRFKKPEKAAEILTEARRRFPGSARVFLSARGGLSSAKKYQEALTVFEQALLEAQNSNSEILQGGDFYFQYGNAAEEAGLFDKASRVDCSKSLEHAKITLNASRKRPITSGTCGSSTTRTWRKPAT